MIPIGTRVRLSNELTGSVAGYWHDPDDPEPDQPLDVPFPYVIEIAAGRYVMSEDDFEVIEP
jgi:hypothetical protein